MSMRSTLVVGLVATAGSLVLGAAPALAVCDSYSGVCTSPTPGQGGSSTEKTTTTAVNPTRVTRPAATQPDTLPFTGGELVLMTAVGAGALAGGTALVVAGRRKKAPAA